VPSSAATGEGVCPVHDNLQHQTSPLAVGRREAAVLLGISERLLWTWTNAGTIPHVRIGTRVLYPVRQLQDWLDRQASGRTEQPTQRR
jgi:excisionase family DNA binding protein